MRPELALLAFAAACGARSALTDSNFGSGPDNTAGQGGIADNGQGGQSAPYGGTSARQRGPDTSGGAFAEGSGGNSATIVGGAGPLGGLGALGGFGALGGLSALGGASSLSGGTYATGGIRATTGGASSASTQSACDGGGIVCGTGAAAKCVDPNTDPLNCGLCGSVCANGASCVSGGCKPSWCEPSFELGVLPVSATGSSPVSLAVGDFDRDGKQDVATANDDDDTVSILLGRGNTLFAQRHDYPVGNKPQSIAVADLDRDGNQDLVTANTGSGDISVLLGDGKGVFEPYVAWQTDNAPVAVAIGDLNGDKLLDVVTANASGIAMTVLFNAGDATFVQRVPYTGDRAATAVALGDLNGDGLQDIARLDSRNVNTFIGRGDGTFYESKQWPIGESYSPKSLAIGDVNGDGTLDLAVADRSYRGYRGRLCLMLGNGDGTFPPCLNIDESAAVVLSADLNGDRFSDFVTLNSGWGNVLLGTAGDILPTAITDIPQCGGQSGGIGDFNNDGYQDVVTANSDGWVDVQIGNGNGTFKSLQPEPTESLRWLMAMGDLNGDTIPDGITVGTDSLANVWFGDGVGGFVPGGTIASGVATSATLRVGDFNRDRAPDLVLIQSTATLFLNDGTGAFPEANRVTLKRDVSAVGDVDGDGNLDLILTTASPTRVSTAFGNGDGTFELPVMNQESRGDLFQLLAVTDVNGDNTADLIMNTGNEFLSVQLGDGNGAFNRVPDLSVKGRRVVTGDLNEDGRVDLVAMAYDSVTVLLGDGQGGFNVRTVWRFTGDSLEVVDLNRDGHLDTIASRLDSDGLAVLFGAGDGTFGCEHVFNVFSQNFGVGDMNGDGRPDVVTDDLTVLLNTAL